MEVVPATALRNFFPLPFPGVHSKFTANLTMKMLLRRPKIFSFPGEVPVEKHHVSHK